MSHIHLPDGVIPLIWWVGGFIVTFAIMALVFKNMDKESARKKIPIAAVMTAIMLITMSVPLGFIPFHINLSALAGIILGPGLGFVTAFVVNLFMAMLGHGGFTVIGLNTLVIGTEAVLASLLFREIGKRLHKPLASGISVGMALVVSISLMIAIVGLSGAVDITSGEAFIGHEHEEEIHEENSSQGESGFVLLDHHGHEEEIHEEGFNVGFMTLTGWSAFFVVVLAGIVLEAVLAALIVGFFVKVRPDILQPSQGFLG